MNNKTYTTQAAAVELFKARDGAAPQVLSFFRESENGNKIICTLGEFEDADGILGDSDVLSADDWDELRISLLRSKLF